MKPFKKGDIVRHIRTENIYRIVWTPGDRVCIEHGATPAYGYRLQDNFDDTLWIRPATEMEDGRFLLVEEAARAAVEEACK